MRGGGGGWRAVLCVHTPSTQTTKLTTHHPQNPKPIHRDPATKLRTLVLNSGLWSPRYDNADLPKSMPDAHMAWVEGQLQAARTGGEKVSRDVVLCLCMYTCLYGDLGRHALPAVLRKRADPPTDW